MLSFEILLEKTEQLRIILISSAQPVYKNTSQFNFQLIAHNVMKQFLHDFQLNNRFHSTIDMYLDTQANFEKVKIFNKQKKQNTQNLISYFKDLNVYILTTNQKAMYKLIKQNQKISLQERKDNYYFDKFIRQTNIKNIFYYKRFSTVRQQEFNLIKGQQSAIKNIDIETASQIYSLINVIVHFPLKLVFQQINGLSSIAKQELTPEKRKHLQGSFQSIKDIHNFDKWTQNERKRSQVKNDLQRSQQSCQFSNQQEGFNFQLYNPKTQIQILIAKLSNQISNMFEKTSKLIINMRSTSQTNKLIELEKQNKNYLIILIRALNSLKPAFPDILKDFEGIFFEELILTSLQSYEYFCIINQMIYSKSIELNGFLNIIKHSNKQMLTILKKINIRNILKDRKFQIYKLQEDLKKLNQLEKIMEQNKISQFSQDKQLLHKKYILSETKAFILHQIGLLKPQQSQQSIKCYQEALQLLMQIYTKPIKNIEQDLSRSKIEKLQNLQGFQYDDRKIRSRISHILNNLCEIELSIQVQKSLNQTLNVSKLYKKWILLHSNNDKRLNKIFLQAIDYFKSIGQFHKVQQLYNLIIQKCPDSDKKQQYRIKLCEFLEWLYLPTNQQRTQLIKGLKTSKKPLNNPLNKEVIERITKIYKYQ